MDNTLPVGPCTNTVVAFNMISPDRDVMLDSISKVLTSSLKGKHYKVFKEDLTVEELQVEGQSCLRITGIARQI